MPISCRVTRGELTESIHVGQRVGQPRCTTSGLAVIVGIVEVVAAVVLLLSLL